MNAERIFSIINLLLPDGIRAFVRLTRNDGTVIAEKDLYAQTDSDLQNVIDRSGGGGEPE